MPENYQIIINHYTDGISGHFNVTFAAVDGLEDFTAGINLRDGFTTGIGSNYDGVIKNENEKLNIYLENSDLNGFLQRKSVSVTQEQYESLRTQYETYTLENSGAGRYRDYVAFAHPLNGENCTFLPADILTAIGSSNNVGDFFSYNELSQSFAGTQVWNNLTNYNPSNASYNTWYNFQKVAPELIEQGILINPETMPAILEYIDSKNNSVFVSAAEVKKHLLESGLAEEQITYEKEEQRCFAAGTQIDMADGTQKPIETIEIGDEVLAYDPAESDGRGGLRAAKVTRTLINQVPELLDFHGLKVTPGHATLCGDGANKGRHIPLMDILLADGAIVDRDSQLIRAATNLPVGSEGDQFVEVAYITSTAQKTYFRGRMRAGTLTLDDEGNTHRVLESLKREGYRLDAQGLIAKGDEKPHPLYWAGALPKPADYVLKKSGLTVADLYATEVPDVLTAPASSSKIGAGLGAVYAGMTVN